MTPGEELLAHHVALLAIPAIVPAVVVVGVVLYIARKDRIAEREEHEPWAVPSKTRRSLNEEADRDPGCCGPAHRGMQWFGRPGRAEGDLSRHAVC
ncbi:hypothetical protein [Aeromicrobium sp. UC242_57]|uniref:hypothetical protein n=1 Tax=Aeromicrobium sp. UC242_57 TaxID=3374624 RepID=UPI0037B2D526